MKLMNITPLLALAVLFVPCTFTVADAKMVVPTSIAVTRKKELRRTKLHTIGGEATTESTTGSSHSLLSRVRGGITNAVSPEFTFYMDIAMTLLVGVFMYYWLQSRKAFEAQGSNYLDQFPNFNKQVLVDGFCVAQDKSKTLFGLGTLKICGIVDALLIISSYFIYRGRFDIGSNKLIYYSCAAYTALHGAIHGFEVDQTGQIWDLQNNSLLQNISGVFLLALITVVAPIGINGIFEQAGRTNGMLVGISAWIGFVLFYMFGIKEKVYALTYINVTIFLSIFAARALVFKKNDERRLQFYRGSSIVKGIVAITTNIVVMCFEPLACKDWFETVGGHVWFDITLWVLLMSNMK